MVGRGSSRGALARPFSINPTIRTMDQDKRWKPSDLPMLQSTKFMFVLSIKMARTVGSEVPPSDTLHLR